MKQDTLNNAMAKKKMSNLALAKIVGKHPTTISRWRTGVSCPYGESLNKLEQLFGCLLIFKKG